VSRQTYFPAAAALALASATACTIDEPALNDGGGDLPTECSRFADLLVTYTPPDQEEGSGEGGERALGEPDGEGVLLDVDGVLIVGFVGAGGVEDGEEDDLIVHATGEDGAEVAVYASESEGQRRFTGLVSPDETGIDLATARVGRAVYLEFVGTEGSMTIDAVEATRDICGELTAHTVESPQLVTPRRQP
jgi:hypothetical protein